jgi:hypothetical protein
LVIIDFILKNIIKLKIISYYTHTSTGGTRLAYQQISSPRGATLAGCLPREGISNLEPGFKKLAGRFSGG